MPAINTVEVLDLQNTHPTLHFETIGGHGQIPDRTEFSEHHPYLGGIIAEGLPDRTELVEYLKIHEEIAGLERERQKLIEENTNDIELSEKIRELKGQAILSTVVNESVALQKHILSDFNKELERFLSNNPSLIDDQKIDGFNSKMNLWVGIVLQEIFRNHTMHGNRGDLNKVVLAFFGMTDPGQYTIISQDEGNGFSLQEVADCTAESQLERSSGRGIYLMKHFADVLEYDDRCGNTRVKVTIDFARQIEKFLEND